MYGVIPSKNRKEVSELEWKCMISTLLALVMNDVWFMWCGTCCMPAEWEGS